MCCADVGLQWQTGNRSTAREKKDGLRQPLALELEQSCGRTGALLSKLIDRTAKSLYRSLFVEFLTALALGL
jgi:hypothetical protein